jgi:transmembrane sensor
VSASTKAPLNEQVLEEAATWFIEFRGGNLAGSAREEFLDWLRRSPEHIRAYLDISETYVRLPASDAVPPSDTERLIAHIDARIQEGVVPINERSRAAPPSTPAARRTTWRPLALAASLIVLVAGSLSTYLWSQRGLYTTGAGEERTVTLSDASRIQLNARTRLRVVYTKDAREIELLEGQALFQVAKDEARPFIVHSGETEVRAVGTEFDVNKGDSGTTVTVLEGRVAVVPEVAAAARDTAPRPLSLSQNPSLDPLAGAAGTSAIFLSAGEQLTVTPRAVARPHAANVSAATAWTRGQLEFEEAPLSEVADEYRRLSGRQLIIEDAKLRDFKISGVYSSVDPASLILFLRSQPDLEVTEQGDQIRVRRK